MNQANLSPVLIRAITRALRPLVRLMLAGGITYPVLAELLKGLFVEVADKKFALDEKSSSDSRIHLLTGVHRKDVKRLRGQTSSSEMAIPATVALGTQLVSTWLEHPDFIDAQGLPRKLPRLSSSGTRSSFEQLVLSRSKDIRARVVLDEWLRLGIVSVDADDCVSLNAEAFIPKDGLDEKLYFFAHNLHDHAAAATHNLLDEGAPWLERSVAYDALSEASVAELNAQAQQLSTHALKTLNQTALRLEQRDAQDRSPRLRFTYGLYFYSTTANKEKQP
jgi:Family of unknown function (DUF6502)